MTRLTQKFIRAVQRFEASGELAPLLALFDPEGEALTLGRTEPARGTVAIEEFWLDYRSAFREIRSEFTHVIEGKEGAVLEWLARGALAQGEPVQYRGVSVLETAGGRVRRLRIYYDSSVFLTGGAASDA